MEIYDAELITGLLLCCGAGFLIGILALRQRRALDDIVDLNRLEMVAMMKKVGNMQERLDTLGRGMLRVANSVEQIQITSKPADGYDQASTLARSGASTEQLIDQCGITRGEADLLRRLNASS